MSFVRVWIHYVWSTKNRLPILTDNCREALHQHIREYARTKNIYIDRINGYYDHVHCLVSLDRQQSIEIVAQLIKGESSFWFNNRSGLNAPKLNWQNEYYAASVSDEMVDRTRAYIDSQMEHHQVKTFLQEYEELMRDFGFPTMRS